MTHDQELKLRAEAQEGREAQDLLEHPLQVRAFQSIWDDAINQFINSAFADDTARREAWQRIQSLNLHRKELLRLMTTGQMAEAQLQQEEALREFRSEL